MYTFKKILSLVKELRIHNQDKPIVLMGYMNNFLSQGESLFKKIKNAGVDGSVVVGKLLEQNKKTHGYDAQNEEYCDMFAKGIIEPVKVVRTAVQ